MDHPRKGIRIVMVVGGLESNREREGRGREEEARDRIWGRTAKTTGHLKGRLETYSRGFL